MQQIQGTGSAGLPVQPLMVMQDLSQLRPNPQQRVQGCHRILADQSHLSPSNTLVEAPSARALEDGPPVPANISAENSPRRIHDSEQRLRENALPRTRLTHETHRLAGAQTK